MKHLFVGGLALLFLMYFFCACNSGQQTLQTRAEQSFSECAQRAVEDKEWVSFRVDKCMSGYFSSISFHFAANDSAVYYISYDSLEIWRIGKEKVSVVNLEDRDLFTPSKKSDWYYTYMAHFENRAAGIGNYYLSPCHGTMPDVGKIAMVCEIDTVCGKVPVKCFVGNGKVYSLYDGMTRKLRYKYLRKYRYWIDKQTCQIDSVVISECRLDSVGTSQEETNEETYRLTDFSYTDKSSYFDSLFGFSSARYDGFSRYDENSYPSGSLNDSTISEVVQRFPLVGLGGDTIRIADENGWLLLDFWSFNCKPCMEHLLGMATEKETHGCRKIEKSGIKVLAVNYYSDNMDLIRQIADRTASNDIIYSGKRLNTELYIPTLGYSYLLAPNKDIVYKGNYDYLQIIEAKANYEKQHQNK